MKGNYKLHEIDALDMRFLFELMADEEEIGGTRQATDEEIDAMF